MEQIEVRILDREYRLAVPADGGQRLRDAAAMVDDRMRTVRDGARVSGADRIAVMAALQLALECIGAREGAVAVVPADTVERIRALSVQVDDLLKAHDAAA